MVLVEVAQAHLLPLGGGVLCVWKYVLGNLPWRLVAECLTS